MSKLIKLFIIPLFVLTLNSNLKAQSGTIDLQLLGINSIDFAAFAFERNLSNQPRIFQVVILPEGMDVIVEGSVSWMKNDKSSFQKIANFRTKPFKARTFSNSDIGTTDIDLESSSYNSDLLKDNLDIGKPTGRYSISVVLFNVEGRELGRDEAEITFLNPTAPALIFPTEGSSNDVGAIMISWTPSIGAESYVVRANYMFEGQSPEEALYSADPLVNNKNVGTNTTVNMRDSLDRELLADKKIVIVVKSILPSSGGENELASPIVTFYTSSQTGSSSNQNIQVDPNILQLAELLNGKVSQNFINQLKNGEVTIEQIQITDENNNNVTFNDLLSLLQYLNTNEQSLISIEFTAQ
jgi:hypothetical protein